MIRTINLGWNDYYEGTNDSYYTGNIVNDKSYYIYEVVFSNSKSRFLSYESGTISTKILVESSLFYNNEVSDYGCNLYLKGNGNFVQKRVCSFNCSSTSFGQHCYIRNSDSQKEKNYNIESSYSKLGKSNGDASIHHGHSEVIISRVNVSYCSTNQGAAFWLEITFFEGNFTYSLFLSNTATNVYCFNMGSSKPFSIINCNIHNNSSPDQLIATFNYQFTFKSCIITQNEAANTFYGYSPGKSKLIHCIYELNGTTEFVDTSDAHTNSFENDLYFYETYECKAELNINYMKIHSKFRNLIYCLLEDPSIIFYLDKNHLQKQI